MDLNLEEQLAIAKNLDMMEKRATVQPKQNPYLSGNVDSLDNMVYGKDYMPTNETRTYNAEDELKKVTKELPKDLSNCKLPKTILESIKANPLNGLSVDPKMDSFTEMLSKSLPSGLQKSLDVQKQLEELDKKNNPINEQRTTQSPSFESSSIKDFIKEAVREVISEMGMMNESRTNIKAMKMLGDKFLFLDDDNNVYECNLTFKGKNKKKK